MTKPLVVPTTRMPGVRPSAGSAEATSAAFPRCPVPMITSKPSAVASPGRETRITAVGDLVAASRPLRSSSALAVGRRYTLSKAVHEAWVAELDRRLRAAASTTSVLLSHPGMAVDSRSPQRPGVLEHVPGRRRREPLWGLVGAGKDTAAWSAVRAVADPAAEGGQYWGPAGRITGPPVLGAGAPRYRDPALGRRVWEQTEELTGAAVPVA